MTPNTQTASAVTHAAPAGGANGAGIPASPEDARVALARLLASEEAAPATETEADSMSSTTEDPEAASPPTAEAAPGEENLESEETPNAEAEENTEAEAETENGSATEGGETQDAELQQALAGLSPTERQSALELVKSLQPGELPRIAKLVAQRHQAEQTIEAQARKIEELESGRSDAAPRASGGLPASVAKLKTVNDVEARLEKAHAAADAIQDFLDANPGGPDTEYEVGDKRVTRAQLIESRKTWREELKALPMRAQQLQQQGRFTQAQAQARKDFARDFPTLADPENAEAKAIRTKLQEMPFLAQAFVSPDYAAAVWIRGERAMQEDLAKRKGTNGANGAKGNGNGGGKPALTLPPRKQTPGGIPIGKPHPPAGGATRVDTTATAKAALEAHKEKGSRDTLAAVIEAGNFNNG
jgi:hypothetical protein